MADSKQEIIRDVKNHIKQGGGGYGAWYVGVSADAYDTLFSTHGIRGSWFIYRQADSPQVAKEVRDYLVNKLGTEGGGGGADEVGDMIYAYKKAACTVP